MNWKSLKMISHFKHNTKERTHNMKFLKKLWAKICGLTKYLVYIGKVIQALKVISNMLPMLAAMAKPEQKKTFDQIAEVLQSITGKLENTEKYLNDMGIATGTEELQTRSGEKLTVKRSIKMLEKIDADMA